MFEKIRDGFNRAVEKTLSLKKILLTSGAILLAGIFFVFFQAISIESNTWLKFSLALIPCFIAVAILLSCGILLIRTYHDEIKGKEADLGGVVNTSANLLMSSIYFVLPLLIAFLILWLVIGLFVLLASIPAIGPFFGALLAFVPYILTLGSILIFLFAMVSLFYVTPVLALRGIDRPYLQRTLLKRIAADPFTHLLLLVIGYLPVYIFYYVLITALNFTTIVMSLHGSTPFLYLSWIMQAIPISLLLSPAYIFFFNFAAEAHVLLKKQDEADQSSDRL